MKKFLAVMALTGFCLSAAASTKYSLDTSHSSIGFNVTHLMISKVPGKFEKFEASFQLDEKTGLIQDLQAKIDLDSVDTGDLKRDAHLRNPDFFGVRDAKNKLVKDKQWMSFKSSKVETKGGKTTSVLGDLTLNGVTKPVTLAVVQRGPAKDPWGKTRVGFEASTTIKRSDFGITWNKTLDAGGVVVSDEVDVLINGEAIAMADEKTMEKAKK
jgi:polyisoprenoid-binding protein YceI